MDENTLLQQNVAKGSYRWIILVTTLGIILSVYSSYISGNSGSIIYYRVMEWLSALALAILIYRICKIISIYSNKRVPEALPFFMLAPPFTYSLDFFFRGKNEFTNIRMFYDIAVLFSGLSYFICVYILLKWLRVIEFSITKNEGKKKSNTQIVIADAENQSEYEKEQPRFLGKDNFLLDKVIQSIIARANNAGKTIGVSLIVMVLLVVIGGGASLGTVVLSEAKKIRELETERWRMLDIIGIMSVSADSSSISGSPDDTLIARESKRDYDAIKKMITDRYGNAGSYKDVLERIERESKIGWSDIALRITIAALTLFLVQIFFHIYKYNQQQNSHLLTKAEILELYKESGANQDELRSALLSKLDGNPGFGEAPSTTTDKVLDVISKLKETK